MSWYDDEFYNEPSEFDIQMEEFKESLAKAVKSEFLEEMERLKMENQNLQSIKENFEQIKRDYERKKYECEMAKREAEEKAKHMRTEELLEKYKIFLWTVDWEYLYGPKCDKCKDNRTVEISLPSGKKVTDECKCSESRVKVMIPQRMVLWELSDRDHVIAAWYKACGKKEDRYYTLSYASSVFADGNIVKPGTSFDTLAEKEDQIQILFRTKEECLAYCEYLNKKNHVPLDAIYKRDGSLWEDTEED